MSMLIIFRKVDPIRINERGIDETDDNGEYPTLQSPQNGGAGSGETCPGGRKRERSECALPGCRTRREGEVLYWVAQGKRNGEIGQLLGVSPEIVKKHLAHIFERLRVEMRTAAVARAFAPEQISGAARLSP